MQGEIKAKIRAPSSRLLRTPLKEAVTVKLEATLPDNDRVVPNFDVTKTIRVQYPVQLVRDGYKFLDSLAPGSSSRIQWQVGDV